MVPLVHWNGRLQTVCGWSLAGTLLLAAGCAAPQLARQDQSVLPLSEDSRSAIQLVSFEQPADERPVSGSAAEGLEPLPPAFPPAPALPEPNGQSLDGELLELTTDEVEPSDLDGLLGGEGTATADGPLPPPVPAAEERYPLDLATALKLAGANNLQIQLAAERVREAYARLEGAEVLWVPNLSAGVQYNRHDGPLQDTSGEIRNVSRQSLYAGGGPFVGDMAPLSGGASGPARLFVDLSLADIYFEPLAAKQAVRARQADEAVVFNDMLLEVARVYLELLRAQTRMAIAAEAVRNSDELARLTAEFAETGVGLDADALRARTDLAERRRELLAAEEELRVVSAELARLLRLPQEMSLFALETQPVPVTLIPDELPLEALIAQGLTGRPELARHQALVAETLERVRQESWRPWLPHLFVGFAGAGFGGGPGSRLGNFGVRGDLDALAVWEVRNFGLGNRALRRERESLHRQAHLEFALIHDQVAADVTAAWQQVRFRRQQVEQARAQVEAAAEALPLNIEGIRGLELRAIEGLQAVAALATARERYLAAVIDYNRAQFELLRALGRTPETLFGHDITAPHVPHH